MKKFLLFGVVIGCICCISCQKSTSTSSVPVVSDSTACDKAKCDSLTFLATAYENHLVIYENDRNMLTDSVIMLNRSIEKLKEQPVMTNDQFVRLYKYDRLLKYYQICKRKPTQWKYYKGWSIRVFEL